MSVSPTVELGAAKPRSSPISRKQVEKVVSRSVAVFGLIFGAQTVPWLIGQVDEAYPQWLWIVVPALFVTLVLVAIFSFAGVWVRQAHALFAIIYLAVLLSWPLAVMPDVSIFDGIHWLNYLITVATAMAAVAFSTAIGSVYLFLAPTIYTVIRSTPLGGAAPFPLAVLEGVYALLLGAAVMIIITMLRQTASSVDSAQATALERYGRAVRQHATEVERVKVDSIVHDSVLTTLSSVASASTPRARELAASMATDAIRLLEEASATTLAIGTRVAVVVLAERLADAATVRSIDCDNRASGQDTLSAEVAETIYSASVQAMINSLQHAGGPGVRRWVVVSSHGGGIEVEVGDDGAGFALDQVPPERLGIRVSIVERVANAGGNVVIASSLGDGAVVTIRWPHEDDAVAVYDGAPGESGA